MCKLTPQRIPTNQSQSPHNHAIWMQENQMMLTGYLHIYLSTYLNHIYLYLLYINHQPTDLMLNLNIVADFKFIAALQDDVGSPREQQRSPLESIGVWLRYMK